MVRFHCGISAIVAFVLFGCGKANAGSFNPCIAVNGGGPVARSLFKLLQK